MCSVNIIRNLLQTNIPDTTIKFITNYIKGRQAYTAYINHTSRQRQFKIGVPQGGVISPTRFNIYSDLLPSSAPVQVMSYVYVTCYLDKTKQSHTKSRQNTFTPDPVEYTSNLDLKINNNALPHGNVPKDSGSYL